MKNHINKKHSGKEIAQKTMSKQTCVEKTNEVESGENTPNIKRDDDKIKEKQLVATNKMLLREIDVLKKQNKE